jgi:hypothetical protein
MYMMSACETGKEGKREICREGDKETSKGSKQTNKETKKNPQLRGYVM